MESVQNKQVAFIDVLKPSWYVKQMQGWSFSSYLLLLFGLGVIAGTTISGEINFLTIITMIAGMLGFTTTVAITNTRPLNGVFGLISALIYSVVAFQATNYADVVLQVSYIILLDLPVLLMPSWSKGVGKKVRHLKNSGLGWSVLTILFFGLAFIALYFMDTHIILSQRPLIDSLAGAIGLTGALLATLRFSDQYWFWTAQGIFSVILWGITAAQGAANLTLFFTYILYLANDFMAFFDKNIAWFHKDEYLKNHPEG